MIIKPFRIIILFLFFVGFSAKSQETKVIGIADLKAMMQSKDAIYVFNFWATWCKPCVAEIPYFEQIAKDYSSEKVKVVFISLDFLKDFENVKQFSKERNIKSSVFLLNEPDYNSWLNEVSPQWSGAIPATLISDGTRKKFYEQSFDYQSLNEKIKQFLK